MLFNEGFLENVREEPILSIVSAIELCMSKLDTSLQNWLQSEYDYLFETYSLVSVILESFNLQSAVEDISLEGNINKDCISLRNYLDLVQVEYAAKAKQISLETMKNRFHKEINNLFTYEFSQGDLDRIQVLINELRKEIKESNLFETKHQERLLKRLEKLQAEMHKKMSDIDRFWGLVGDAGVVLGKFGKDSKPFVDRIREISDIVWRTQSRAEELPSNTPSPTLIEAEIVEE
ncbi:hypothetical protein CKA55_04260 [Arcobacter suis]|uniref:Uncharacterized protein n=1 Tax=Arcobacter suis CECT 7833 TaxID=663365 RepID=A0AAD0SS46_9BACT|nr:hypothetical protein [Arcobacter suis]AXX90079.1 hypothetical protein ASUIS_1601 [Arcobacter suis CECT 7833]RWS47210.1 hypothetical protein CKA55_04260 [Arcobacter suis]